MNLRKFFLFFEILSDTYKEVKIIYILLQKKEEAGDPVLPEDLFTKLESLSINDLKSLNVSQLTHLSKDFQERIVKQQKKIEMVAADREAILREIGNKLHESVPISDTEVS